MYLVQKNNKTIAVTADFESAMAVFHANQVPFSWLQVIDAATDNVVAYWIG